ncbi:amino acid ABC transporter permease [Candidatus Thioglobus sp.]|jgi:general L-amino acid transport system permease protein|uniref:amino acid ABC transporter permease n=1 Tax=unclassified Candidatus Pseudothioglobus TaxID=3072908 RepID=UPI0023047575|nr:amino acid ABC transporter permease [Candidatus Thioglobus sp.]MDB4038354.1 amino acid ABC transporter permease [Candidatus Thioglobus sp.]MDB9864989.1 amino acid ABC transporter permease [Candidatus Thioglobus sp.]MDB9865822.1 amino acid ABC transporter permease [Candidatus Thioglobus sp.]MDB9951335.1 amino acid ABC transporter permease [Candidatus Thioglobus sp.]|tara:strand:- start:338 stop:1486 length:1149 start_codon:yes stop_codon:yes gene_type:complete
MSVFDQQSTRKPPISQIGAVLWLRTNLFSSWINSALTLASLYLLYIMIPPLLDWMIFNASFSFGTVNLFGFDIKFSEAMATNQNCGREGACWPYIYEKLYMYTYGFYPRTETWRPNIVFGLTALLFVIVPLVKHYKHKNRVTLSLIILYPLVSYVLIAGGFGILMPVSTDQWGGLLLTLIIASVGIIVSFPIGVLLALGRQSNLKVIKLFSTLFIEFIRAVPLITILFMASFVLPLFLESGNYFDKLLRALIGIALFQAAYFAEVVRGGLQAIPRGQYEAADAIGLSYFQKNVLIILPQALKISIPNIVGSSISLFKDTTLVLIIGLFDMLAMVNLTSNDPYWLGRETEGFVFVTIVMWAILYTMSRYSRKLELRFNTENTN